MSPHTFKIIIDKLFFLQIVYLIYIYDFSSKIVEKTRPFSLGEATSLGEGKIWIQTY